jgi:uncharacterized FAD-dependent dehydrogenase
MCPGGELLPIAPREGRLGTNGMSRSNRAGAFANSAVITTVPVAAESARWAEVLAFRRELEEEAWRRGGGAWGMPAQRAADFVAGRPSADLPETSCRLGVTPAHLGDLFPERAARALAAALVRFEAMAPGFAGREALVAGPESRVSAPVRILRGPAGEAEGMAGLYPCGEGSGYASGIVSSALDGRRAALAVIERFAPGAS